MIKAPPGMSQWSKPPSRVSHEPQKSFPIPTDDLTLKPLGYDDFALASYADFCKLRGEGIIESGVRFQVSLPTPLNVIASIIDEPYQVETEPLYEKALLASLRRIQDNIPTQDLAIQWDMAREIAMLETPQISIPWFHPLNGGIFERFVRPAEAVDEGVQMGIHLCYGDHLHKHFLEPRVMGLMVEFANGILGGEKREINYIHMPVPKERVDEGYFAPLKGLTLREETELFLGLAHGWDEEGTRRGIEVSKWFVKEFGVATECGMGRTPADEFESVLEGLAAVT
jgi:hypothetical protein